MTHEERFASIVENLEGLDYCVEQARAALAKGEMAVFLQYLTAISVKCSTATYRAATLAADIDA